MNRRSFLKIIKALANLIFVILVEAGRTPVDNARKMVSFITRALVGGTPEQIDQELNKK